MLLSLVKNGQSACRAAGQAMPLEIFSQLEDVLGSMTMILLPGVVVVSLHFRLVMQIIDYFASFIG
jgi:hypothetical protein